MAVPPPSLGAALRQLAVRTLHPQVIGRVFTFTPGDGVVQIELVHGELASERCA